MRAEAHAQGMASGAAAKAAEPVLTPPDVEAAVKQLMKLVLVKTHFEKQTGRKMPDKEDFFANLGEFFLGDHPPIKSSLPTVVSENACGTKRRVYEPLLYQRLTPATINHLTPLHQVFGDAANPEESFDVSLDNAMDEAFKFATDHRTADTREAVEELFQEM